MKIIIRPNEKAIVFINSKFSKIYEPGVYKLYSWFKTILVFSFPIVEKSVSVINQEILTKDNVALRLSFTFSYLIQDIKLLTENFTLKFDVDHITLLIEQKISNLIKIEIRNILSTLTIFELNEKRDTLFDGIIERIENETKLIGLKVKTITPLDFSFPKNIQDIFAKLVEAKVRSQTDLENARTQVATARTLKNAAELMKGDENLKFFQYLETISRIASKGNHSFIIGTEDIRKH
ncbi:slipin family protein [Leptospira congkakensis]|uniref:slipin family protein n=1 Tax=Leptospira congkakensis TaxID=2484932 RepID=UPI00142E573E|nr:slipin family protein [Leptospira congkakensis]